MVLDMLAAVSAPPPPLLLIFENFRSHPNPRQPWNSALPFLEKKMSWIRVFTIFTRLLVDVIFLNQKS